MEDDYYELLKNNYSNFIDYSKQLEFTTVTFMPKFKCGHQFFVVVSQNLEHTERLEKILEHFCGEYCDKCKKSYLVRLKNFFKRG